MENRARVGAFWVAFAILGGGMCAAAEPAAQPPQAETIYGDDDRLDLYQVLDQRVLRLADSTVGLFDASSVSIEPSGMARLAMSSYGERLGLCKEERFYDQPSGAFCSGFLVGADLLATAGHCVESASQCENIKFVFGFSILKEGAVPDSVPAGEVYGCKELVGRVLEGRGADWSLVRLDRPVSGHEPLRINRDGAVPGKGQPLFVIGHPAGLPTKVAGGASVRDPSRAGYFVANLDTYGGNSGSAVFDAATGLVAGILVRGEVDYVHNGTCVVSNVCAADACRGEDVTRVTELSPLVPGSGLQGPARSFVRLSTPGSALGTLLRMAEGGR